MDAYFDREPDADLLAKRKGAGLLRGGASRVTARA